MNGQEFNNLIQSLEEIPEKYLRGAREEVISDMSRIRSECLQVEKRDCEMLEYIRSMKRAASADRSVEEIGRRIMNGNEVKLPSGKEVFVLELLAGKSEMYGLEMVKESSELKRGTIYVLLDRMEDKGFISSRQVKEENMSGLPRRLYEITDYGQKALKKVTN